MDRPLRVVVVVPVFNEAENLAILLPELAAVMDSTPHDVNVLVVDDGSSDGSSRVAGELGAHVLRSGRNLGKAAALQAGFDWAVDADVVVTMDGDLQDDPAEIPTLIERLADVDLVSGWKRDRKDSWSKRLQSRLFTAAVRMLTKIDLHDFNCGLKAYRREVLDQIHVYGEHHRLIPVLAVNAGFTVEEVPVHHRPREHGQSKYSWTRAFRGPLDLITILFLSRFGQRPLHVFGLTGLAVGGVGTLLGLYLTWIKLVDGQAIGDRPLLMLAVLLVLAGLQLFAVGLLGEMLLSTRPSTHSARYRQRNRTPVGNDSGRPADVRRMLG